MIINTITNKISFYTNKEEVKTKKLIYDNQSLYTYKILKNSIKINNIDSFINSLKTFKNSFIDKNINPQNYK